MKTNLFIVQRADLFQAAERTSEKRRRNYILPLYPFLFFPQQDITSLLLPIFIEVVVLINNAFMILL
jgi:hypothetical protein